MAHDGIPYLIQRVRRRKYESEHNKGFDRIFELDYMGSSEFEFGTIPQALKAMRARNSLPPKMSVANITIGKNVAYYVGDASTFDVAVMLFEDELRGRSERKFRHKERTAIYESYNPSKENEYSQYDAWWALDAEVPFFLFKDKKHAEELLALL